ncbi:MAG: peptide-methionine (S)-S-oxide reductase [Mariniblastus sp.]
MGYTGGVASNPTYRNMGDHTEAMQVDFDPADIGFEEIASLFWRMHNPCGSAFSTQYRSAIWYHDPEQQEALERTLVAVDNQYTGRVTTAVEPLGTFYLAENYHQKYRLQSERALMSAFNAMYPDFEDFNRSTAVARLNGFLSGTGSKKLFEAESESYGLTAEMMAKIRI